jgi:hypothetical protein
MRRIEYSAIGINLVSIRLDSVENFIIQRRNPTID